jgi:ElaB/YqjD/DUF883 family membrane-anchored ribosome-binding protein
MANSTILIDPEAANADISKLRSAITKLEDSQSSIKKLSTSASEMTGETGTAITEKCTELSSQVSSLISNLNYTIRLIQAAVKEYQEKDSELAAAFRKGGV